MSFFPALEKKDLPDLIRIFGENPADLGIASDETQLFFEEVAFELAKSGRLGVEFLLESISRADVQRLEGILAGFSFADKDSIQELLPRIKTELVAYLSSPNPDLMARAVDGINALGFLDMTDSIRPLLHHESPYVVGSALRFFAAHFPSEAKFLLLRALQSPQPIVRANAIDELDDLECKEALAPIAGLLDDPDKNVRCAAKWAVEHLESV